MAFVAATSSICGAMLVLAIRSISAERSELSAKIDAVQTRWDERLEGLRNEMNVKIDGLRNEMNAKIDGVRNEMNARIDPLERQVERLEEDLRALNREHVHSGQPQLS